MLVLFSIEVSQTTVNKQIQHFGLKTIILVCVLKLTLYTQNN